MRRGDGGAGTSSALGMHGGSVIGASPGATGAAVVTVQGDGVIVYDVETQVLERERSSGSVPRALGTAGASVESRLRQARARI